MRQKNPDIAFESLSFDEKGIAIPTDDYVERCVKLPDNSTWFFREWTDPKNLAQEALYWDWVNRFFPETILERRTVYKMDGDEKIVVGSCWEKLPVGISTIVQTNIERLNELNVPIAMAILFFHDQSYSQVNAYSLYNIDNYKIDRFEFSKNENMSIVHSNKILIRDRDSKNTALMEFLKQDEKIYSSCDQSAHEKFYDNFWLALLNIVLMPNTGWDSVMTEKQNRLRRELLNFNVAPFLSKFSKDEFLTKIGLFCRQFTECNSASFFEYRDVIIKNYCLFSIDLFLEKIKSESANFVLALAKSDSNTISKNRDDHTFHVEIIKSIIGKIYLNTRSLSPSEFSLENFNRCVLISDIVRICYSLCGDNSQEMALLSAALYRISTVAVNAKQLNSVEIEQHVGLLKIDLNQISESGFARQCINWLKWTETDGLRDVLLNKNLLLYIYQRSVAQFKGSVSTSYPRFLSDSPPALPEGVETLYQKMVLENNPNQLCEHVCELIKIVPSDFWNLFLRQLAMVVFCEKQLIDFSSNAMLICNSHFSKDIQALLTSVKVSSEALVQLNMHFKEALTAEIKENQNSQTAGFHHSGSSAMFSEVSTSRVAPVQDQQAAASSSLWSYVKNSLPWNFK
jgi:hypothetical protein